MKENERMSELSNDELISQLYDKVVQLEDRITILENILKTNTGYEL